MSIDITRRQLLRLGTAGALFAALPRVSRGDAGHAHIEPARASADFHPDLEMELAAAPAERTVLPGQPTRVWQFRGRVLKGDREQLAMLPGDALPVIRARNRQKLRVHFVNHLPQDTIVHWHGLHIPPKMDGHPMYAIRPGARFVYEFQVDNRAATYWFHPHPHGQTGEQVYRGLAGALIVSDEQEQALGLPAGEHDLTWVIQDRTFDRDNQLVYARGMMERMMGFVGNRILVNGHPDFVQPVATTAYRVRLLNGSNARIYKLARDDGRPLIVIGNDGGLIEKPLHKAYVTLAPGERIELWMDFSDLGVGAQVRLRSLPFNAGMTMMRSALPNGSEFDVLTVRVDRKTTARNTLPATLTRIPRYRLQDAVNRDAPRTFELWMGRGTVALNGRAFDRMDDVAENEIVRLGTLEAWEFANDRSMMMMAHPMHIHNLQFQVIQRKPDPRFAAAYRTLSDGFVDEGWKDVVLVMPGERVRLLMKFTDHTGLYIYHCHILEHEDLGMMRNYLVRT
jgi:FtsP/CotA-like multicopper oxidase with cupredoxin domain